MKKYLVLIPIICCILAGKVWSQSVTYGLCINNKTECFIIKNLPIDWKGGMVISNSNTISKSVEFTIRVVKDSRNPGTRTITPITISPAIYPPEYPTMTITYKDSQTISFYGYLPSNYDYFFPFYTEGFGDKIEIVGKSASIIPVVTAYFNIEGLSITDTSVGEYMLAGSVQKIKWSTFGVIENVKIEYTTDGGTSWQAVSTGNIANTGEYDWTLPEIESQQCQIRISDAINEQFVDVSYPFTIYFCDDEELLADFDDNCIVDMRDFAVLVNQWLKDGNPFN